jgi:hypothetical protein
MYLSPQAAAGLACQGLSLLLIIDWETRTGIKPGRYAALATASVGLVTLLGYVNGVPALYGAGGLLQTTA